MSIHAALPTSLEWPFSEYYDSRTPTAEVIFRVPSEPHTDEEDLPLGEVDHILGMYIELSFRDGTSKEWFLIEDLYWGLQRKEIRWVK